MCSGGPHRYQEGWGLAACLAKGVGPEPSRGALSQPPRDLLPCWQEDCELSHLQKP